MKRFFTLAILLLVSGSLFAQNGTRLIDYNAKSTGRGGTSIGTFDSPALQLTNPAGLAFLNGVIIDANFSLMTPSLNFENGINNTAGEDAFYPLPSLAGTWPCMFNDDIQIGAGFFTTGGMGAEFNLKHELYKDQSGNYIQQKYYSQLATMQGGISAAYRLNDQMAVGVSLHLVFSLLEFEMPYSLDPSIMAGIANPTGPVTFGQMFAGTPPNGFGYTEVTASANMNELSSLGFNGKLGFAWKPSEQLSVGLSYTLPTALTYEGGKASMDMTYQFNDAYAKAVAGYTQAGSSDPEGDAANDFANMGINPAKGFVAEYDLDVELAFPQSFGAGAAYQMTPSLLVSADFEWINWSSAFDKMSLKLRDGNNSNINTMINSSNLNIDFPLDWEDAIVVKVGGEYQVNDDLTARAGYAYGSNPVPTSTVFPVFPAIVESHVMLGGSYAFSKNLTVHGAWEMALNNDLKADSNSLIANEYNNSTSELGNMFFHVAVSYSF